MELKNMIKDLSNLGCKNEYGDVAIKLYETGKREELIRYLKKVDVVLWMRCMKVREGLTESIC